MLDESCDMSVRLQTGLAQVPLMFHFKGLFLLLDHITASFPVLLGQSISLVQTQECFKRRIQRRCVRCDFD